MTKQSCVTLMSVLFALNSEEYVCRKVCHPICCVIPTFAAARRIIVRIRRWPQYGLCPCAAVLANTQSSAWLYCVWSRHILRAAARRESRGTGFCDASVLQGPTTWKTIERVTLSSFFWKSMSCHLRPKSSLIRKPVPNAKSTRVRSRMPRIAISL